MHGEIKTSAMAMGMRWLAIGWVCAAVSVATQPAQAQTSPSMHADNIVVILDASGSMSERMTGDSRPKMDVAKQALLQVMNKVPVGTNVGLLVFSGSQNHKDWLYPLGPIDPTRFRQAVNEPQPYGNTPLGQYLKKGADRLLEQRTRQKGYGTYRLLVVTDGKASDPRLVKQYQPDLMRRGLVVDVIGVAMAEDHSLATKVHSYRRANDADALIQAVSATVAEIGSGKQDTAVDQESFAMLAGLPDGMADAMLAALQQSGNQPIGEEPVALGATGSSGSSNFTTRVLSPPSRPTEPDNKDGFGGGSFSFVLIVIIAIVLFVLRILKKAARGD